MAVNTLSVSLETIFPASHLTDAKFSLPRKSFGS